MMAKFLFYEDEISHFCCGTHIPYLNKLKNHRRDRMVVGFITTYVISAHHH